MKIRNTITNNLTTRIWNLNQIQGRNSWIKKNIGWLHFIALPVSSEENCRVTSMMQFRWLSQFRDRLNSWSQEILRELRQETVTENVRGTDKTCHAGRRKWMRAEFKCSHVENPQNGIPGAGRDAETDVLNTIIFPGCVTSQNYNLPLFL